MTKTEKTGHALAFFTILIWGVTFISSKVLLRAFTPEEIIILRFVSGYLVLWILYPHPVGKIGAKAEFVVALAGAAGVTLYYLCENTALLYTYASNVGIVISSAPFLTTVAVAILFKERIAREFMIGLVLALAGVMLVNFNSTEVLHMNPLGGWLAVLAAACWAGYSCCMKLLCELEMNMIALTRRIFMWGLLFLIPYLFKSGVDIEWAKVMEPVYLGNILFLGVLASAICYVTWNWAIEYLGAVKSSIYINLQPIVSVIFAAVILDENITAMMVVGMLLVIAGLFVSEFGTHLPFRKNKKDR